MLAATARNRLDLVIVGADGQYYEHAASLTLDDEDARVWSIQQVDTTITTITQLTKMHTQKHDTVIVGTVSVDGTRTFWCSMEQQCATELESVVAATPEIMLYRSAGKLVAVRCALADASPQGVIKQIDYYERGTQQFQMLFVLQTGDEMLTVYDGDSGAVYRAKLSAADMMMEE